MALLIPVLIVAAALGVVLGTAISGMLGRRRSNAVAGRTSPPSADPVSHEPVASSPAPAKAPSVSGTIARAAVPSKAAKSSTDVPEKNAVPDPPARVATPEQFREVLALQAECLATFREQNGFEEREWRAKEVSLFVVSDAFGSRPYYDYLVDYLGPQWGTKGRSEMYRALGTCRFASDLFEKAVALIPPADRPVKIGRITEPVEAEIYEIRS